MSKSESTEARRKLVLVGSASLLGIPAMVAAWVAKARSRGGAEAQARRLASRIELSKGAGMMMEAFARDPGKVERFRELTRWRKMRDEELRKV